MTLLQHLSCTERFDLIAGSNASLVLITTTPAGHIVDWNAGAQAMFGWTREEAAGQPISIIFTPADVDDGVPAREMQQAREQGSAPDTRWMRRKDGGTVFADGELTALRMPDGEFAGFVKVLRDASAILHFQQSDATLRAMVNATPHMVWSADGVGRADYFNERMLAFIGAPVEALLGHGWTNFVHPMTATRCGHPGRLPTRKAPLCRSNTASATAPASSAGCCAAANRCSTRRPRKWCGGWAPTPTSTSRRS